MGYRCPQLTVPSGNFQLNVHSQLQSPLFARVPAEIRLIIYSYTIVDYEFTHMDPPRYPPTCPCYSLQRHAHTELLRTCKRILQETWSMPFQTVEHRLCNTHTSPITAWVGYSAILAKCAAANAENGISTPHIQSLRYLLRKANGFEMLQKVLRCIKGFEPKCVVIEVSFFATFSDSIRFGRNLRFCKEWANVVFPVSVTTIKAETYGSKSDMDGIITSVLGKWHFRRADGAVFKVVKIERVAKDWGTLVPRDYDTCPPNALAWFIKTVTWEPVVARFGSMWKGLEMPTLTGSQNPG